MKKDKTRLSAEDRLLLKLISIGKSDTTEYDETENIDWDLVIKTARLQGVSLFAFAGANKYRDNMSHTVLKKWVSATGAAMRVNYKVYEEQQKLVSLFGDNIKFVILKGLTSAAYYDRPEDRMMGDVDILVSRDDIEKAQEILLSKGYKRIPSQSRHDILFKKSDVLVEMHYTLSGVPGGKYGKIIDEFMENVFDTAVEEECVGYKFRAPNAAHHALTQILHLQHHMYYSVAWLKQILDWAQFVEKTANEPFWKDEILPLFEKTGLLTFVKALTKACSINFHSTLPDWAKDYAEDGFELIKVAFDDGEIALSGNSYTNADVLLSYEYKKQNRFTLALKLIHRRVLEQYPFVKKWIICYPFLYMYKVLKYSFKIIFGGRKDIKEINEFTKRSKKIYDKFHIFEKNKW